MSLLSQIIALSLFITSVIKVAGVFIELDKNLVKRSDSFKSQTHKILQNEKGHFTFVTVVFLVILSGLLNFYVVKNNLMVKEARFRKDSYLCMKFLNTETSKYIDEMNKFNHLLKALFLSYSTGVSAAKVKLVIEVTKKLRDLSHLNYLKKISFNSYCPEKTMASHYLKNLPYETLSPIKLKTQFDETATLRKTQWSNVIFKRNSTIRLKKAFCLKTTFQLQNSLNTSLRMTEEEIPLMGLASWKCSFG